MENKTDDWVEIPVATDTADDWEELPVKEPSIMDELGSSAKGLIHGASQALTLGYGDNIIAGMRAGIGELQGEEGSLSDKYEKYLREQRGYGAEVEKDAPISTGVGALAGGLAMPVTGVAGAAAMGAAAAHGYSDRDLDEPNFGDLALGAALGGGATYLGQKLTKLPETLKKAGERRAFKAAVGNQQAIYDNTSDVMKNKIGRTLLDKGVVGFGDKASGIAAKADSARRAAGGAIGDVISEVDELYPKSFDGKLISDKLLEFATEIDAPVNRGAVNTILEQADEFANMGSMDLREAQRIKNLYKYDPRDPAKLPISKEFANRVKQAIGEQMDETVARLAKDNAADVGHFSEEIMTGTGRPMTRTSDVFLKTAESADESMPGWFEKFRGAKDDYGQLKQAADAAKKLANRQEKNRTLSLTDYIVGGAGFGLGGGNPVTAGAMAVGNKVMRERGSSAAAVGLDKLSDILTNSSEMLGSYAGPLKQAWQKGNESLAVTHYILMKNSEDYRRQIMGEVDK